MKHTHSHQRAAAPCVVRSVGFLIGDVYGQAVSWRLRSPTAPSVIVVALRLGGE